MNALEDSVYRIGEAEVDLSARSVRRDGQALRLRPKSFEVLQFLLRQQGRIVTKNELLSEVWAGVAVTENSLVKCISELRKALGDDLKHPQLLQSIPKVGYQLVGAVAAQAIAPAAIASVPEIGEAAESRPAVRRAWQRRPMLWAAAAAGILLLPLFGALHLGSGSRTTAKPAPWHWQEVAWWKFNEGQGEVAHDSSGHGLDGAIKSGASWQAGGEGGLSFNGLDAAVSGTYRGVLPAGDHARTLSAWIKAELPHVDVSNLLRYGTFDRGPKAAYFAAGLGRDGRVGFGSAVAGGSFSGTRRLDDAWHMVTVTYDGPATNAAKVFIDGDLDRASVLPGAPRTSSEADWRIGQMVEGWTSFRGSMKDVRVFDRALTESQIEGLYSCSSGIQDLGDYYYLPVMLPGYARERRPKGAVSTPFRNGNHDFSGIQLAKVHDGCAMTSVEGADVGQDLRISMEARVPTDAAGNITQAGPYFRSRIAGTGDGLLGGTSAGYWVQLHSNGMLKVRRLNPLAVVAFTAADSRFDPAVYHALTMEARGKNLQVWLDGKPVRFEQGGRTVDRVEIPAAWESPEHIGDNQGAAGVAFGAEDNRGQSGGQQVRKLAVEPLR
jgi:DNA-binding winged helix-turn-helix (wHTH) protein